MQVTLTDEKDAFTDIAAVTTFYLNDRGFESDPTGLCNDAAAVFAAFAPAWSAPIDLVEVRAYEVPDLLGANTGPPKGEGSAPCVPGTAGVNEVALCLSYYSGANTPRRRGRMYLGPLTGTQMNNRPSINLLQGVIDLGAGINALGGLDVSWVQYSPTDNVNSDVTDYYVDNAWDTQRSRGLNPTGRQVAVTGQ